jgi:hypothetical protein
VIDISALRTLLSASTLKLPLRTSENPYDAARGSRTVDYVMDADDEYVITTDGGYYGPEPADCDLLVALVNAAPQLLAIAEAAQIWYRCAKDDAGHTGACGRHHKPLFDILTAITLPPVAP